jgi:tetratricopeptide (TPR) repeat protein
MTLLRLTDALWLYWYIRGYGKEGSEWMERAIAVGEAQAPAALRASALMGAGNLAYGRKDFVTARRWFERRLALAQESGDVNGEAAALGSLGNVANDEGDHECARSLLAKCLASFERLGDAYRAALARANLALASQRLGDYRAAEPLHEQSLAYFRMLEDKENIALGLVNRASTLIELGCIAEARSNLLESLSLIRGLKDRRCSMFVLANCIKIAIAHRSFRQAAVMIGALEELRKQTGIPVMARTLVTYAQERSAVQDVLGDVAFASALMQGQGMPLEQVIGFLEEEMLRMQSGTMMEARRG